MPSRPEFPPDTLIPADPTYRRLRLVTSPPEEIETVGRWIRWLTREFAVGMILGILLTPVGVALGMGIGWLVWGAP